MELESARAQISPDNDIQDTEKRLTESRSERIQGNTAEFGANGNVREAVTAPTSKLEENKSKNCVESFPTKNKLKRHCRQNIQMPRVCVVTFAHVILKEVEQNEKYPTVHRNQRKFECTEQGWNKRFAEKQFAETY